MWRSVLVFWFVVRTSRSVAPLRAADWIVAQRGEIAASVPTRRAATCVPRAGCAAHAPDRQLRRRSADCSGERPAHAYLQRGPLRPNRGDPRKCSLPGEQIVEDQARPAGCLPRYGRRLHVIPDRFECPGRHRHAARVSRAYHGNFAEGSAMLPPRRMGSCEQDVHRLLGHPSHRPCRSAGANPLSWSPQLHPDASTRLTHEIAATVAHPQTFISSNAGCTIFPPSTLIPRISGLLPRQSPEASLLT